MKLFQTLGILLLSLTIQHTTAPAADRPLAFPGADGYAKYITGGRGGKVYYVTSLDDCTDENLVPGTLRWALRTGDDSPRTILFAVNGTIYLNSKLKTNHPNVSILGQSAPGGGICVTGYPVVINSRNYIVRYVRFRAGDIPALETGGNESYSGLDIENATNVLLDHCSVTWSMEECLTMFDNDTTTVQYCIVGEGLYHSYNVKTTGDDSGRAFAMQWGGDHSNMHHVLITNCNGRAPRFNGVREANAWLPGKEGKQYAHDCHIDGDFANNVLYNWGGGHLSYYGGEFYASLFADAPADLHPYNRVYMRNNYFRPGPSTKLNGGSYRHFFHPSGDNAEQVGEWYLSGNHFELSSYYAPSGSNWSDASLAIVNNDNLAGFGTSTSALDLSANYRSHLLNEITYPLSGYEPVPAEQAYQEVTHATRGAGANLPRYDEEDQRLVDEAGGRRDGVTPFHGSRASNASRRPGIIDTPADVTFQSGPDAVTTAAGNTYRCYPSLALRQGERYAIDADADGMPDAYEVSVGLNPTDPTDGAALTETGYTNLENYLNGLADFTLNNADYQTSDVYVAPGAATRPEQVTITFVNNDPEVEGQVPAPLSIRPGDEVIFAPTWSLYKEGYTLTGWTDGNMTYRFGLGYKAFVEDVTLRPALSANNKELDDRTEDISLAWDFTLPEAPTLNNTDRGIYVAKGWVDSDSLDVCLRYNGLTLSLPAAAGAVATVTYKDGAQMDYASTSEVLTLTLARPEVRNISITLPYIFDPTGIDFHSVEVGAGTNYELVYGDTLQIDQRPWMHTLGQRRNAYRNCLDPTGNDEVIYSGSDNSLCVPLYGFIVGRSQTSTYKLVAYVKDCARVRTYVSGSNSNGDQMQLTAIPADGSEKSIGYNLHKLNKSGSFSEYFDLELDPTLSYMLEWSSVSGYDMMVGAIKFYDASAASAKSGEVSAEWTWQDFTTDGNVPTSALTEPDKVFVQSDVHIGEGWGSREVFNNAIAHKPDAAIGNERDARYAVQFCLRPAAGFKFKPTRVSFYISMSGSCTFDVDIQQGTAAPIVVKEKDQATPTLTQHIYDVAGAALTSDECVLTIYPYASATASATARRFALHSIVVEGEYDSHVVKHKLTTQASPAEGGVISVSPKGTMFAETAQVVLSATPTNGFLFQHWTNGAGDILSNEAKFTYTVGDTDELLTAHFKNLAESDIFSDGPFQAIVGNAEELTEALAAAKQHTEGRYYIFLRNGDYDFGTKALTAVPQNTSLIGESQEGVVIHNCPAATVTKYQEETPVLFIDQNQNQVYMQDITVRQARDWSSKTSQGQAIAIRQRGKQAIYKRVTLQGVQDTYYLNKADGTAYFEDCSIYGEVDFIYGDGTAFFQRCTLLPLSSGAYITAPNTQTAYLGMVFNHCVIDRPAGAKDAVTGYRLGRPWGDSPAATFLHTTMNVLPAASGWGKMNDGLVLRFHEYDSKDAQGQAIDLSSRSLAACSPASGSDSPVLTESQASAYTLEKVFPDWNPADACQLLSAPTLQEQEGILSWTPVADAYCYAIVCDGQVIDFTTQTFYPCRQTGSYTLRVVNRMGGLGEAGNVVKVESTGIETITSEAPSAAYFDLLGRRTVPSASGIQLQSGKRVLILKK
jgi:hypothetical protein